MATSIHPHDYPLGKPPEIGEKFRREVDVQFSVEILKPLEPSGF